MRLVQRVKHKYLTLGLETTNKDIIDEAGRIAGKRAREAFLVPGGPLDINKWSPYRIEHEGWDPYGLVINTNDRRVRQILRDSVQNAQLRKIAVDAFMEVISHSYLTKDFIRAQLEDLIHGDASN